VFLFITYSLWKTKFCHRALCGSVIPFLRLNDFKKEFFPQVKIMMEVHEQHGKDIAALKLLKQKEKQFYKYINLINDLQRVIVIRYINRQ
jgi:hypothetical protein